MSVLLGLWLIASPGIAFGTSKTLLSCQLPQTATQLAPAATQSRLRVGVTDNHPTLSTIPLLRQLGVHGVHDYVSAAKPWAMTLATLQELKVLAKAGYAVNLNMNDETGGSAVPPSTASYIAFVKRVVDTAGSWVSEVEITNEPNLPSPTTSDGLNYGIINDIVGGVTAAHVEVRKHRWKTKVGFNYVYSYGMPDGLVFWTRLKAAATPEFLRDVDWMGLHTYPNPVSLDTPVNDSIDLLEHQAIATGRCWASWLGLSAKIPIDITEVGYPTARGSSEYAAQAEFWSRVLAVVQKDHRAYGVRTIYVFLLQDAPSTPGTLSGFGLFDSAGRPKPSERVVARIA